MLCIATPNPNSPAETFIRQHINRIAPGNTVVLYFQGDAGFLGNQPTLKVPEHQAVNHIGRLFQSSVNMICYSYPGVISGQAAEKVEEFLQKNNVKSILAEFGPTGCALVPICRRLGIRLAVYFHGYDGTVMPRRWTIRRAYQYLNKYADVILCASRHFSQVLVGLGFDRKKIHVVPYGIEMEQFKLGTAKDPDLMLAVGRFVDKKAPHLTIQAYEYVLEKYSTARLEMIGDGPLLQVCEEMVEARRLKGKVVLHGVRDHEFVKQKLATASLFVQHSVTAPNGDTESLGVSLLEAMASEVPVVATRHNGFVETVQEGVTGFLVDEMDVAGMAERMIQVLGDRHLRDSMGRAGRIRISENYEAGQMAKRLSELIGL